MAYLAISRRSGPMALTPAKPNPRAHAPKLESIAKSFCNPSRAAIIGRFALRAFCEGTRKGSVASRRVWVCFVTCISGIG